MNMEWKTELCFVDAREPEVTCIERAASWLKRGELVAFPTETVYGLGADGGNAKACAKIYEAKGRPSDNPLILHVADVDALRPLVQSIPPQVEILMSELWPGPMTLIFRRSDHVPDIVTAGGDTVAIRLPEHPVARAMIRAAGCPVAAPSANRSGRPSPTNAQDVWADMAGRIPMILDGGSSQIGIESTVIDVTVEPAMILRPGYYTREYLETWLSGICLDHSIVQDGVAPRSPGQKYRHYAPKAELTVYVGSPEAVNRAIQRALRQAKAAGKRTGAMLFDEDPDPTDCDLVLRLGSRSELSQMGHFLFSSLRAFDRAEVDVIFGVGVEALEGYGISIMNRLKKSAGGRVVVL